MKITKMHGLGNDFILVDNRDQALTGIDELARRLCRRALSVGADGLILVENSARADSKMRIINADGSEAEMCGNGIRCFARYLYDRGWVEGKEFSVETLAGIMFPQVILDGGQVSGVRVNMGRPDFRRGSIPMTGQGEPDEKIIWMGKPLELHSVLMGVPHTVVIEEDLNGLDEAAFAAKGRAVETNPLYPQKTNVDFVQIDSKERVRMETWERGAGHTMACGTGACAAGVVLNRLGLAGNCVKIVLRAGSLMIEIGETDVYMTGPAEYVFEGELR